MKTAVITGFEKVIIELDDIEEVKELVGILGKVDDRPRWLHSLYQELRKTCGVPMGGLYTGVIRRYKQPGN